MFFIIVLEYLKISDTPDMTKNHCFSSFMATRWPITWALLNKLDVLHLVLFNESDMFHLALFNKLYVLKKKKMAKQRIYIPVGSVLEYLKISDTPDMTKNHCFSSLFWSIWKFQIPRTWPKIIVFHHLWQRNDRLRGLCLTN